MTQFVVWLNVAANGLGRVVLAPISILPGWVSATLVATATGIVALIAFKYTSNQRAIKQVRNDIKADLLALSLFKDNIAVSLKAQGRILVSAVKLLVLAVVPMLVMLVPMSLLLGQLALWYQVRPLAVGEESVITLQLFEKAASTWPEVRLEPIGAIEPTLGPVRVRSERRLCWNVRARENGLHHLVFTVADRKIEKEIAIGHGFMRASLLRPRWSWTDALLHPWEAPFPADSPVQSIEIDYPTRESWTSGSDSWIVYWCIASTLAALLFRRVFNVNL